jgi:hypothetical protein
MIIDEVSILRWAAGAPVALPRLDGVNDRRALYLLGLDEERLLDLVREHRLAQRFLARVRQERPGWCTQPLLAGVARQCAEVEARVRGQMAALREISAAVAARGSPVMVVKGCSTYALTGDVRTLRFSADLDLFYEDEAVLWDVLWRLGYTGERLDRHEFGVLHRGDIGVEIHRQFPVCSNPPELAAADLAPERNPGVWRQPAPPRPRGDTLPWVHHARRDIRYADLAETAVRGLTPDTADLWVPDVTMSTFVFCAHEFRDFIEPSFKRRVPVQLAVLADIFELARHPQFDRQRFMELVKRFDGQDTVGFVGCLLASFFGSNPLPVAASTVATKRRWLSWPLGRRPLPEPWPALPRALSFHGCWAAVGFREDCLVPLALRTLVERLGANAVGASTDEAREPYAFPGNGNGREIGRVILQSRGGTAMPFHLGVTWGREALTLGVTLSEPLNDGESYHLILRGGLYDTLHHWVKIDADGTMQAEGAEAGEGQAEVSRQGRGCTCRISFPWVALPRRWRVCDTIAALLHLLKYHDAPEPDARDYDPVMVVPLVIARPIRNGKGMS